MVFIEGIITSLINDWLVMICLFTPLVAVGLFTVFMEKRKKAEK